MTNEKQSRANKAKSSQIPKRNQSVKKQTKGSLFNSRVSTGGRMGVNINDRSMHKNTKIRDYSMNRSTLTNKKTRPGTYGDKSRINYNTENVHSLSNVMSNSKSFSKKRITSNKSKLSHSKSKHNESHKKIVPKEQEILITKTYDLTLSMHK